MKKTLSLLIVLCLVLGVFAAGTACADEPEKAKDAEKPVVYFTDDISPEGLVAIYEALNWKPVGPVAVKLSTGEPPNSNYLRPELIADLVHLADGTIVECNTAYKGSRFSTSDHQRAIEQRGYNDIAEVDIMDAEGEMRLPVRDTTYMKYNIVGDHLANYDFMINLAHFKGHQMAGFGGVLKNQSIGVASKSGKCYIHSAGTSTTNPWGNNNQDSFLESMAAAAQAVHNYFKQEGKDIVYINVMNNLSVDCDCDGHPAAPQMNDIGILASTDPVALDKACLDLIFNYESTPGDNAVPLQNRITQRHGTHTVEYAEEIGLGTQAYNLIDINTTGLQEFDPQHPAPESLRYNVFSIDGKKVLNNATSLESLPAGIYIINGKKQVITK